MMKTNGTRKKIAVPTMAADPMTSPRVFSIGHLPSVQPPGQRDDDDGHQQEQHDASCRRQAIEACLVLLVDHRSDGVGGETRTTACHRPDQVERPQPADQGQGDHRGDRRASEGQGDMEERVQPAGAVNLGCLEVVGGNGDDAGDKDDRGKTDTLPNVHQGDGEDRQTGVGQPAGPGYADDCQRVVDEARLGFIKTVKVRPTPTVLTSTGKKMTERR